MKKKRNINLRAGDKLLEFTLVREPSLEIKLLGGSVVESAGDDGDNTVGDAEGLVESLGVGDHVLEHLPRPVVVMLL